VVLAVIAVVVMLGGRDLFEGLVSRLRERAAATSTSGTGTVSGRVRFADGSAAVGARVTARFGAGDAGETTVRAGLDGAFDVDGSMSGGMTSVTAVHGPLSCGVTNGPVMAAVLELSLPPTFDLAGLVQTGEERTPVAGALIRFAGVSTRTDEAGAFSLKQVSATAAATLPVRITVEAEGFATLEHAVPVDAHPAVYRDLLLLLEPVR
jgi:hypothetical protein